MARRESPRRRYKAARKADRTNLRNLLVPTNKARNGRFL